MFLGRLKKKRKGLQTSLRFEIIGDAVRRYPDGREICLDNKKGEDEYLRRTLEMAVRQNWICGRGPHKIIAPTFDHANGRGMGSSKRDDRIVDAQGNLLNVCSCWLCNGMAGSRRIA